MTMGTEKSKYLVPVKGRMQDFKVKQKAGGKSDSGPRQVLKSFKGSLLWREATGGEKGIATTLDVYLSPEPVGK